MCTGNTALPVQAVHRTLRADRKQERQQLRRQEERQAEYDALAERRAAKEEALAAEMKAMRQDARADQKAQQSIISSAPAPAPSPVAQSMQIIPGETGGGQAPTATLSTKKGRRTGPRTAAASLRMGSISSGAGAGPNITV